MRILNRLTVSMKLTLVLGAAALSLVVALGIAATFQRERMMDDRIAMLRGVVEVTHGLAQSFESEVVAGRLTREQAIERFRTATHAMWYNDHHDYIFASSFDGVSISNAADPKIVGTNRLGNKDVNGKPITGSFIEALRKAPEAVVDYYFNKPGQTEALPKVSFVKRFEPWNALIGTGVYVDDIAGQFRVVLLQLGITALIVIAITAAIVFAISRNITGALHRLKTTMAELAAGRLETPVSETERGDEIGAMAQTVQVFKDNALAMRNMQSEQDALKQKAEQEKKALLTDLADDFEKRVSGIVDALSRDAAQMQSTARSMSSTAESTREKSLAVASAAN